MRHRPETDTCFCKNNRFFIRTRSKKFNHRIIGLMSCGCHLGRQINEKNILDRLHQGMIRVATG
ncbi:Uncharacterized protein dnm_047280 [Desulfonema magnum]|uniref:Uncharacterized protein n=1 Tax=Desulfonema magnum TaxID=45655 RepID=A0A975BNB7_9BACT|nr:Uncharacterized protein dnm_047280 [Desulfonema magnum]